MKRRTFRQTWARALCWHGVWFGLAAVWLIGGAIGYALFPSPDWALLPLRK